MTPAVKLQNFRDDNPYDIATQAKRLLAAKDDDLIRYVIELGLTMARQRDRHEERRHIKETGFTRPLQKVVMSKGKTTGSIIVKMGKKTRNAAQSLILDVWRINGDLPLGDATAADLGEAIIKEEKSLVGHAKNKQLYQIMQKPIEGTSSPVRSHWTDNTLRPEIEEIYGEFRTSAAA